MSPNPVRPASVRKCPICSKPRSEAHTPFCSQRCRDRDLMRWLDEGYVLPGPTIDPEDEE
ncbi:DNA gyrase inhibitor YacG [Novosphingobium sp. Chol11]|uniref:DNA gyrase inhibitor YacG n=1 Tax=Novosphingobium sp. Chol11 TaxID=1385763 RepID=UPI0025F88787|nr:DNA gyrase inhibitor YacG [Novosphingobium sp. Chol11]